MPNDERHFHNSMPDYEPGNSFFEHGRITDACRTRLRQTIDNLYDVFVNEAERSIDVHDHTVYTGTAGIAMTHWKMAVTIPEHKEKAVHECRKFLKSSLEHVKGRNKDFSFYAGDAGPYALGCYLYKHESIHHPERAKECQGKLVELAKDALNPDPDMSNEVLYGRAGFLYTLLYLANRADRPKDYQNLIDKAFSLITTSGNEEAQMTHGWKPPKPPLVFKWHDKYYIGAAHGFAGILYLLMKAELSDNSQTFKLKDWIKPTVDYLIQQRYEHGNFPSSLESEHDKLVQWCHGAPGAVFMLCEAARCFDDQKYVDAAVECGEVVWKRGLLQKGFGLCHGAAGNAYTFIELYRLTKEEKYLYRAVRFADWCCEFGKRKVHTPDRPYSLMEGMAGVLYFLLDVYNDPAKARFPAFDPACE